MWVFLCQQQVWAKCKSVRRWLCSWQWILEALVVLIIPRYLRQRLAVKLLYRNLKYIKLQGKRYCCRSCCKEGFLPLSAGHKVTTAALDPRAFPYGQRASSQSIGWRDGAYVSFKLNTGEYTNVVERWKKSQGCDGGAQRAVGCWFVISSHHDPLSVCSLQRASWGPVPPAEAGWGDLSDWEVCSFALSSWRTMGHHPPPPWRPLRNRRCFTQCLHSGLPGLGGFSLWEKCPPDFLGVWNQAKCWSVFIVDRITRLSTNK